MEGRLEYVRLAGSFRSNDVDEVWNGGLNQLNDHAVTCLAINPKNPKLLYSGSRDKTICIWTDFKEGDNIWDGKAAGEIIGWLEEHCHIVTDICVGSNGKYLLSASCDNTLKLWELESGECVRDFEGHEDDVLSVGWSSDFRQVASASRDGTVRIWNNIGECKYTFEDCHCDWVTCAKFSVKKGEPILVSAGYDKVVNIYTLSPMKRIHALKGHEGEITSLDISPDGSLCATSDSLGYIFLWDLDDPGDHLAKIELKSPINKICLSPNRYWLCSAFQSGEIIITDLETKLPVEVDWDGEISCKSSGTPSNCLCWSSDGDTLYSGHEDGTIRFWVVLAK